MFQISPANASLAEYVNFQDISEWKRTNRQIVGKLRQKSLTNFQIYNFEFICIWVS